MINRIIYKIKKTRIKLFILIKNSNMNKNKFLRNALFHPIKIFNSLSNKVLNIKYVEIVLTTKCTLNCKGCSALMNYYNKTFNTNIDKNIKSLERIIDVCDSIYHLRLLGGEPLLYPNLYDVLFFLSNQNKVKKTTIVTNGTLLIKDERIIEILKEKKFDVFISDYGEISKKKKELIEQLEKNNIKYMVSVEKFMWRDYGNLKKRNRSSKKLKRQFLNCDILCSSILDGQLHHCPRSSHGTKLKIFPLRKQDYIDLLDENVSLLELRKQLYNFFYKYVPYIEACDYCDSATRNLRKIKAGEQCKKD